MSIVSIIIGLVVWLVVPILTNNSIKKKALRKAVAKLCQILGIVIIGVAVFNYIKSMIA